MIGKTMHNESFLATCAYVAREGAIHLGGNMLGLTPKQLAREFALLNALKPNLKKPVVHIVGAFAPGDQLSDGEMLAVACRLLEEQGYKNSLYSVWRHLDGTTVHFHAVTCQIDLNGATISQSFERYQTKRSCRKLEKEFDLQQVANVRQSEPAVLLPLTPRPEPDGLDVELPGVTTVVSDAFGREIREVLPDCKSLGDLAQALRQRGLAMVPQIHAENGQLYGMGYRMESGPLAGSYLAGSKIPGNFSAAKLVGKHGLSFDAERDLPLLQNSKPPAPLVSAAVPEVPKLRRKKKGERKNARHQRKAPRRCTTQGPTPWSADPSSLEVLAALGGPPPGTRVVTPLLGNPHAWFTQSASPGKSLFPRSRTDQGWLARNH
jgi:hypothetical protein